MARLSPDAATAAPSRRKPLPSRREALQLVLGTGVLVTAAACTSGSSRGQRADSSSPSTRGSSASPTGSAAAPTPTPTPSSRSRPDWAVLSRSLRRPLVRGGAALSAAAELYNPRFDSAPRPQAVARCATAAEVAACVRFAADAAVPLAVRAGGHSYGGWSRGRGLMVDTRGLASVSVDHGAGLARIGAGASLIDVYTALGRQGVAVAGGSCPTVGLTGLSLGGGLGVLNRSFGLTCDAIRAVSIVTADGHERSVDARTEPDLFWALRGGGGGFGAVTGLTMQVRPAPTLSTFYLQFPSSAAADVLAGWLRWVLRAPRALWSTCKLLAEGADGSTRVTVSGTWAASPSGLDAALAPLLRTLPAPLTREVARRSYVDTMLFEAGCAGQSAASCTADALRAPTRQPFAATSSVVTAPLAAAAVEAAVSSAWAARSVPGIVEGGASFDALGGAVADVAPGASAFVHRRAQAIVQYTATWPAGTPAGGSAAAPYDSYVRRFRATMSRWLGTSAYCNYADPSIADYGPAYWGANYARLQQVKAHYDPDGRFSFAQSVRR